VTNDVGAHDDPFVPTAGEAEGDRVTSRPGDPLAEVVQWVARGDKEAFAQVYDALAPKVLGLARAVVRNHAMAEEVAQEVLLEVWRQAARYDPRAGSVSTWAMTIAHRRAVDRVRSVRAAEDREDRVASSDVQRSYDEVSEQVEQREDESRVRRAMASLTELQRETVVLAYWGGHTSAEISRRLGVPVPTVKTRLRDGLIRLRSGLEGAT
jgi:RNA polymerase sigma-70 factor (ECF subfamily)